MAIQGNLVVVGAPLRLHAGLGGAGVVFVFERSGTTWSEVAQITPSDPQVAGIFGTSLDLDGTTLAVGAPGADGYRGAAYVFVGGGASWSQQARIQAPDGTAGDELGTLVEVDGDTLAVTANRDDTATVVDAGSAYVFERAGSVWSPQAKLLPSTGSGTRWGRSLALQGDLLLVGGAVGDQRVTLFHRQAATWEELLAFTSAETATGDYFGNAATIWGNTLAVGAKSADGETVITTGAAYASRFCPLSLPYCTAGVSASGCQASLSSTGTPSASAASGFSLLAGDVEGAKDGLIFFGTGGRQASPWGNGTSLQCVVPPVVRAGLLAGTGTPGACDGSLVQDLNALWCPTCPRPGKNPGAGALVQAQCWFRDPLSTSNQSTSLSSAIEFSICP